MAKKVTVYGVVMDEAMDGILIGGVPFTFRIPNETEVAKEDFAALIQASWFSIISDSMNYANDTAINKANNDIVSVNVKVSNLAIPDTGLVGDRPAEPLYGQEYFDITLGKPIWCKTMAVVDEETEAITTPAVWVDATGTTV
jgi:hypothetical protein